jgi:hypothetical protein
MMHMATSNETTNSKRVVCGSTGSAGKTTRKGGVTSKLTSVGLGIENILSPTSAVVFSRRSSISRMSVDASPLSTTVNVIVTSTDPGSIRTVMIQYGSRHGKTLNTLSYTSFISTSSMSELLAIVSIISLAVNTFGFSPSENGNVGGNGGKGEGGVGDDGGEVNGGIEVLGDLGSGKGGDGDCGDDGGVYGGGDKGGGGSGGGVDGGGDKGGGGSGGGVDGGGGDGEGGDGGGGEGGGKETA